MSLGHHRWKLPGNYPVFFVLMLIYHYVERVGEFFLLLIFLYNIYDNEIYYPGETVNIHVERVITIYLVHCRILGTIILCPLCWGHLVFQLYAAVAVQ